MRRARRRVIGGPITVLALVVALCSGGCGFGTDTGKTQGGGEFSVAQVLVLRGGTHADNGLEVLLAKSSPQAVLSPNTWGFPAGASRTAEGGAQAARARATATKTLGQLGVRVDGSDLVPYAHWIAPGFDTIFYLALAPGNTKPHPGGTVTADVGWFDPLRALALHDAQKLPVEYLTAKQLESLTGFRNATDAIDSARRRKVRAIHLTIIGEGDNARAVLPQDAPQG